MRPLSLLLPLLLAFLLLTFIVAMPHTTTTSGDDDPLLVALKEELARHDLNLPTGGGLPLAEGTIRLSSTLAPSYDRNGTDAVPAGCLTQLSKTCFGQCLAQLKINQLSFLLNISSVVAPIPMSPSVPVRSNTKKRCDCPRGLGVYLAAYNSAIWTFPGTTPPRTFNVTMGSNSMLVVRHLKSKGERFNCSYTFEVASGVVMGLRAKDDQYQNDGGGSIFPVWATILVTIAGVLCLSGIAFIIIRRGAARQSATAACSSKKYHNHSQQHTRQSYGKWEKAKKVRIAGKTSLRDPLLELGDEEDGICSTP
ncbi:hypothetical protein VYU27_008441 [Nannochloropsis oceanica]